MPTLNLQIASGSDDAYERGSDGNINLYGSRVINNSNQSTSITRWQIPDIPQGATITSAEIEIYVDASYDDPDVTLTGDDTDNSAQPTSTNYDISDRTKTTASVVWNAINVVAGSDDWFTLPDISAIVQEIVDRPGWSPNNYLSIIWTRNASQVRFYSYNTSTSLSARLNITYEADSPQSTTINPATLSLSPFLFNVDVPAAPETTVNPATLNLSGQAFAVDVGPVDQETTINPALLLLLPQQFPFGQETTINPATLNLSAQTFGVTLEFPAQETTINPATLNLSGQPFTIADDSEATLIGRAEPLPLSATSLDVTNTLDGTHSHSVLASSSPGISEILLKTNVDGLLSLEKLAVSRFAGDLVPELTDTYDIGTQQLLWRKAWISELDTVLFAENTITLLGGWFMVTKDAGTLAADVDGIQTTIDFGKAMTVGDFVVLRQSLQVEYMQVGGLVSGTTYNVTRNVDGSGANSWPTGAPFVVFGQSGDGRIELSAYDTPRIHMLKQGASYNSQTELLRMGDLDGNWGYASETYGLALGEYGTDKANLTWDETNGLRLRHNDDVVIQLGNDGNASIEGVLNLGAAGGIFQGSGTFANPSTGLKLWNDGGIGRLAGYAGGSLQAEFSTDGSVKAGAGYVTLDENGISIETDSSIFERNSITWKTSADSPRFEIGADSAGYSYFEGGTSINFNLGLPGTTSVALNLQSSKVTAQKNLVVGQGLYVGNVAKSPNDNDIHYEGNLRPVRSNTTYTAYAIVRNNTVTDVRPNQYSAGEQYITLRGVSGVPTTAVGASVTVLFNPATVGTHLRLWSWTGSAWSPVDFNQQNQTGYWRSVSGDCFFDGSGRIRVSISHTLTVDVNIYMPAYFI